MFKNNVHKNHLPLIHQNIPQQITHKIHQAKKHRDSIPALLQLIPQNIPIPLPTYLHYHPKLHPPIPHRVVSINPFKAVTFREGFKPAEKPGTQIQHQIHYNQD
ncbi:chorismate synthase, partial [Staphylococcus epidermidis]|uniref:chorismate synthase n=1 Tax=Staphylococcus epidermidis TaxID=1282 RepID=UPI0011A04B15